MDSVACLDAGVHFGSTPRTATLGRFRLAEAHFAPNLRTPSHAHECPAFALMLSGDYVQHYGHHHVAYAKSCVVYRPPAIEHRDAIGGAGAVSFIVEPDRLWLRDLKGISIDCSRAVSHSTDRVRTLMREARRELIEPDASSALAIEGLMLILAVEFSRAQRAPAPVRVTRWLRQARELLDAAGTSAVRTPTLTQLALEVGVHPMHLAACFRRAYGTSVANYVRARRLDAACTELLHTRHPMNEIAVSLGFCSQSHFSRAFRKYTGCTPGEYRRLRNKTLRS